MNYIKLFLFLTVSHLVLGNSFGAYSIHSTGLETSPSFSTTDIEFDATENLFQTICEGNDIAQITIPLENGAFSIEITSDSGADVSWMDFEIIADQAIIFGNPGVDISNQTQYDFVVTTVGNFPRDTYPGQITVNADAALSTVSSNVNQTVCEGEEIAPIVLNFGDAATGVVLTSPSGADLSWMSLDYAGNFVSIIGTHNINIATQTSYDYIVTTTGSSCDEKSIQGVVTVNPAPEIINEGGNINQAVCEGVPINDIVFRLEGAQTANVSGLPSGVTFDIAGTTLTIFGTPSDLSSNQTFSYSVEPENTTSSCLGTPITGQITVNANGTLDNISNNANQTVCENSPISQITLSIGGGATGVSITSNSGANTWLNAAVNGDNVIVNGTPPADITTQTTFDYTVTTTGSDCTQGTSSGFITVNPDSDLSIITSNTNQLICESNPIEPIRLRLSGGARSSVNITSNSGANLWLNATVDNNIVTISGVPNIDIISQTFFDYTITTVGSGCEEDSLSGVITVDPAPSIAFNENSGAINQAVCEFSPIEDIIFNLSDGAQSAVVSGLPPGVTYNIVSSTVTLSGTPSDVTANQTFNYTVQPLNLFTNCLGESLGGSITVKTDGELNLVSSNGSQVACSNNEIEPILFQIGGTSEITLSSTSGIESWMNMEVINGTVSLTGVPINHSSEPITYDYLLTTNGDNNCRQDTFSGTIRVDPSPTISVVTGLLSQSICEGEAISNITFELQGAQTASVTGLPAGITYAIENNTLTISGTASDVASNQTFTYAVEPINTESNCKGTPVEGSIEVNADGEVSVTSANLNQTICEGDPINSVQLIIGGGATGISITSSSGAEGWLNPIPNGTGFVITGTPTEDILIQKTYDYTITTTDSNCTEESIQGVITVNPKPSIAYESGLLNQTVCEGDALGSIVFDLNDAQTANVSGLPNGVTYSITNTKLTISGIASDVTANSTFNYSVEPINVNSSCAGTPVSGTIIVNADSELTVLSGNTDQTLCEDEFIDPIRLSLSGGATGVIITSPSSPPVDLSWLSVLVINESAVITGRPSVDITTPTTYDYTITTTGSNCEEESISGKLIFNPTPKLLHDTSGGALSQTFCEGETITPIVFELEGAQTANVTGLPAGVSYSISGTTLTISGTLSDVATNENYAYAVQPISTNTNCSGAAITGVISVDADGEFSSVSANKDQTLCEGEAIVPIELTLSGGANDVTITSSSGADLWMDAVVNGNSVVITGTPDINISVQETYDYTITTTGSNCIEDDVQGIITVNPKPSISPLSGVLIQDLCEGESISPIQFQLQGAQTANVTGLPAGISYAISGSVLTISGTASDVSVDQTFAFSVEPVNSNTSCKGIPIEGSITVNADGALNVLSSNTNQIICEGTSIAPIQMVLSGGATDVSLASTNGAELWLDVVVNENSVVISGTPIEDITSQKTYDYTITTTGSNCVPDSVQGTIKVNSQPAINNTGGLLSQTVCEGQAITPITFELEAAQTVNLSGLPTGVSYAIDGTTLTISGTPSNVTSDTIYDYSIAPVDVNTNCSGAALTGQISVNADSDLTIISANKDQTLCEGESISPLELTIGGGATGVEISSLTGAGAWLTHVINGSSVVITGAPNADITSQETYDYTITTTGSNCEQESISGTLLFNPTPKILYNSSDGANGNLTQTVCEGEAITSIQFELEGAETANVTGLPAGVTYSISGTTLTVSGTPSDVATNGNYPYSVQPININTNCTGTAISGLINVNADGNLSITSANANQTLCEGEAIAPIELTIGGGATDITITSDSGADISWMTIIPNDNNYTIVGTPTVGINEVNTYDYSITTTGSNCDEDTTSGVGVITVNPLPNLSYDVLTSPGAINQSLREGEAIDDIIFELTDGAQNANVTGLPEGVTYAISGTTLTISGTLSDVSSNSVFTYTVAPININTNCTGIPITGQISVFADGELTVTSGNKDQTLCEGEAMAPIELTIGGGATGIILEELSSPALDINWMLTITDGSSVTITGTPGEDIPSTTVYNYKITTTGSNSASIEDSISGTITVNPQPSISVTSGSTSFAICEGDTSGITPIVFELLDGANTANVTGLPAGITYDIVNTTLTISGTPDDVSSNQPFSYSVEPVNSNTDCAGTAITGVISVQADGELTSTSGNADQTICEDEAITPINLTLAGGATGVAIASTSGADVSWMIAVISDNTVTINGTPGADIDITKEYDYTITTTGSSCGTPAEIQGIITVNPTPTVIYEASVTDSSGGTIDSGDLDQTICEGASIDNIVFTLEGTESANITGLPTGITYNIDGTTLTISGTPSGVAANQEFAYTIQPVNDTTGCTGDALGGTITVNADGELTITSGNADQTICEGESIEPIVLALAGGATGVAIASTSGADVSWMIAVISDNTVTINGTPGADIDITKEYDYTITTTGSSCGTPAEIQGIITVNPQPSISVTSGSTSFAICEGETITNIEFELLDGANTANVTGLPTGITYNIVGATLTISGTPDDVSSNQPFSYSVEPVNSNTDCAGTAITGVISVQADGELTSTSGNTDQTLCEDEAMAPINLTLAGGATGVAIASASGADVSWMNAAVSGASVTITGTPSEEITSPTLYAYTLTTSGSSCTDATINGTITVNPTPDVLYKNPDGTNGNVNQTICEGVDIDPIVFTLEGTQSYNITGLPDDQFDFVTTVDATDPANPVTLVTITGTLSSATQNERLTYIVEAVDDTTGCTGNALGGTITVNADGELTSTSGNADQTICEDEAITPINLTLGGGATGVAIASTSGADVSWMIAVISDNTVTINGTPGADIDITKEYDYTITTTGSSCGTPAEIQGIITVNPTPTVIYEASVTDSSGGTVDSGDLDQTICEGASIDNIVFTLEGTESANVTGLPDGITYGIVGTTLTISGTPSGVAANQEFAYTIQPVNDTTGCTGDALGGTITVNADGELTSTSGNADQTICEGESIEPIVLALAGGATGVAIASTSGADVSWMIAVISDNTVTINGTPGADIDITKEYDYTITTTGSSCGTPAEIQGIITVNPTPTVIYEASVTDSSGGTIDSGDLDQTICEGDPIDNIVFTLEGTESANVTGLPTGITYNIDGTTLTISGTPSGVAANQEFAYTIQPVNDTTGCTGDALGGTITVNADGELTITSGNADQPLCEGESIEPINLTLAGGATGVAITSASGADVSWMIAVISDNTVTINGTPGADIDITKEYDYTITTTGSSCGTPAEIQGIITVNPTPTVIYEASVTDSSGGTIDSGDLDQTICEGDPIDNIVFTLEGTESANVTGLPTGITYNIDGTTLTISGTPSGVAANQEFAYTIQPVNDTTGCTGDALGGTITVNADGELTSTSGNADQTICEDEAITPINLTLAGGATGVAIASTSGADVSWMIAVISDNTVTINGTPGADIDITKEYDYTITTTGSSCGTPAEIQGIITVNPTPTVIYEASVTDSSGGTIDSGDLDQTICEGDPIDNIVFTLEGTESANVTGLPTGITYNIDGTTLTISGTPSGVAANQEFAYTIQPVNDTTGCTGDALGGTITVNADGELTSTSGNADQTICEDEAITPINLTLAGGATGVAIASTSGADVSWMIAVISDNTVTINGTPGADIDITKEYDYTITTTGSSCGTPAEIQGIITVNPTPTVIYEASVTDSSGGTIDSGDLDQTICEGDPIDNIVFTLEGTESANVTGLPTGITYNIDGTTLTISGTPSGVAANQEFAYTIQPVNDTTGCTGNALGGTITVNADGELTITSGNADQTLCEDEAMAPINLTLAGGATGVAITSASGADVSWMIAVISDNTVTINGTPGADIDITKEYDYTITTTGSSCGTPAEIQGIITVNPTPTVIYEASVTDSSGGTIDSGDLDQTICEGDPIEDIVFTLEGTESANVTGLPTGITYNIDGTTLTISGTPSGVAANQEFAYTIQPVNDTTGCTGNALGGTITVNADGELTSTSGNADQPLCEGESIEPINLTLAGGATGVAITPTTGATTTAGNQLSTDLSWMNVAVSGTSVTIAGTPSEEITEPTEYAYTVTTTGNSCTDAELKGTITVNPTPKVIYDASSGSINQTICEGDATGITPIKFNLEGTKTANVIGLPGGVTHSISSTGVLTIQGTPSGVAVNDVFNYTIEPVNSVTNCVGVPVTGTITVNAVHELTSTSGNTDQPLCEGESIEPINLTLAGGATGVVITANTAATAPSGSNISTDLSWMNVDVTSTSVIITGTPSEEITSPTLYAYTVTTTGSSCTDASISGTITVNPTPKVIYDVSSGSINQTICEGDATGITPIKFNLEGTKTANVIGLPGGVTYSISSTGVLTIQGTPSGVAADDVFNYTIEPVNSVTNCVGVPVTGTITVNAVHELTSTSGNTDQKELCEGEAIEPINLTLAGGATDVAITSPSGADVSWMNVAVTGSSVTITGTPSEDIDTKTDYDYTVTTTGSSCTDASINGTITVNPTPKVIYDASSGSINQTVCEGDLIDNIVFELEGTETANVTGLPGGVTYSISSTGVLTIEGTPNGVAANDVFTYTVEPVNSVTNCVGVPVTGTITVNAVHELTSTSGNTDQKELCEGEAIEPINLTLAGGATGVAITPTTGATTTAGNQLSTDLSWMNVAVSGTSVTIAGTPSEEITEPTEYAYTVTTTGNSCTDAELKGTITVNPTPKIVYSSIANNGNVNQTICEGDAITDIVFELSDGAQTVNVTGLPEGVLYFISATGELTVKGTPSVDIRADRSFDYTIVPVNIDAACENVSSVSGQITIEAEGKVEHLSGGVFEISTNKYEQTLCEGQQIEKIEIRFSKNTAPIIENLPLGLTSIVSGDLLEIAGSLDEIDLHTFKVYYPASGACPSNEINFSIDNRSDFEIEEVAYVGYKDDIETPTASMSKTLVKNIACKGDRTGEIHVAIDGTYPSPDTYRFEWSGPNGTPPTTNIGFIEGLFAGVYTVKVYKNGSNNCFKSETIVINEPSNALTITPTTVKNESCNGADGEILIAVDGGNNDFYKEFNWEKFDEGISNWVDLPIANGNGTNYITDLEAGKYRVTVNEKELSTNQLMDCSIVRDFEIERFSLSIESLNLSETYCDGSTGVVDVNVNTTSDNLNFYYDSIRIENSDIELISSINSINKYQLTIDNPIIDRDVIIDIYDDYGCTTQFEVKFDDVRITEPVFDIYNEEFKQYGVFRKGAEIYLQINEVSNYEYVEWNFGDGSETITVPKADISDFVTHEYQWEGKYQITLKAFNKSGCYKSLTKELTIGKGYEITMPTVFTPNNDGINDKIQPVFSGVKEIEFYVFNSNGVMLFKKVLDEASIIALYASTATTETKEWGWGGENSDPSMNYFVYKIVATLLDDEIVTDTGAFILLKQ